MGKRTCPRCKHAWRLHREPYGCEWDEGAAFVWAASFCECKEKPPQPGGEAENG